MSDRFFSKRKSTIIVLLISFVCFFSYFIEELNEKINNELSQDLKEDARASLSLLRADLESVIYLDVYYGDTLATLITVEPDSTKEQWGGIMKELLRKTAYIRSMSVAPDDVIRYIYPEKGNEPALALNLGTLPTSKETVQLARDTHSTVIAGPLSLYQGGLALIARNPVFVDPPLNSQYWGTVSIEMDVHKLFEGIGLYELANEFSIAIRGKDGLGKLGEVFFGDIKTFEEATATDTVTLPHGTWEMAISIPSLEDSFPWYERHSARIIGYSILVFILISFITIYRLYIMATHHALYDELTGLPNRRYFMIALNQLFERAKSSGKGFTLLNLDLNKFKFINDTYGHSAGDYILKEVAKRVKNATRSGDITVRIGGDEFLVLLPRLNREEDVHEIIHKIESSISTEPAIFDGIEIPIRASIGYGICTQDMQSVDELLHQADRSMYSHKEN